MVLDRQSVTLAQYLAADANRAPRHMHIAASSGVQTLFDQCRAVVRATVRSGKLAAW